MEIGGQTLQVIQRLGLAGGAYVNSSKPSGVKVAGENEQKDLFTGTEDLEELEEEEKGSKPRQEIPAEYTTRFDEERDLTPYLQIVDDIARSRDGNGDINTLSDTERLNLARALSGYGVDVLSNLESSKLKILLVDPNNPNSTGGMSWQSNVEGGSIGGGYMRGEKTIYLNQGEFNHQEGIQGRTVKNTRHEVGHAVDDMLAPDGLNPNKRYYESSENGELQGLWRNYTERIKDNPDTQWEQYADRSIFGPHEYLAEGIAHYQYNDLTKQELLEKDPELYKVVEQVLNDAKDPALPDEQKKSPLGNIAEGIGDFVGGIANAIANAIGSVIKGIGDAIGGFFSGLFGKGA
ncbi:MAG: hypothetical protein RDV48_30710 [Candidatus Eremiobacteraeota bacterium]|nr:hypothetical protein [Candidatus Eremiobacteraeota bacterium]